MTRGLGGLGLWETGVWDNASPTWIYYFFLFHLISLFIVSI